MTRYGLLWWNIYGMLWWDIYVESLRIGKKTMMMKWEDFKELLKSQFYTIGNEEENLIKWFYIWKEKGQWMQGHTCHFTG
jgi:hypothetical protein